MLDNCQKKYKIEKFFEESWKIAIFLENTNLKNLSNEILRVKGELELMVKNKSSDDELFSSVMYPQVFDDFQGFRRKYGDVSVLPTTAYFHGLVPS